MKKKIPGFPGEKGFLAAVVSGSLVKKGQSFYIKG